MTPKDAAWLNGMYQTWKLEDGEQVVRLRGSRGKHALRSQTPHAGQWGRRTGYVCVPNAGRVGSMVSAAQSYDPSIKDRSGDCDVLLLGSLGAIGRLIAAGPVRLRAMKKRSMEPERASHLWKHRKGVKTPV